MISRNITRRVERLEAYLAPPDDEPALTILLTGVGHPDRIIEVRGDDTADRRRQPWSPATSVPGLEMKAIENAQLSGSYDHSKLQ